MTASRACNYLQNAAATTYKKFLQFYAKRSCKKQFGELKIYLQERIVKKNDSDVHLSKYEYDILLLLAKSPGRIFGKEMVYDLVWNEPYSGDYNVVMRHICNIREKIEDDPGQPLYIQTVRGVGYRFNGNLGSE